MNLHFLSFIADVFSWIWVGFFYGSYISDIYGNKSRPKPLIIAKMTFSSVIGGLIAVGLAALPEYGFAFYHFAFSIIFTLAYAVLSLPKMRKDLFTSVSEFAGAILNNPIFRRLYDFK